MSLDVTKAVDSSSRPVCLLDDILAAVIPDCSPLSPEGTLRLPSLPITSPQLLDPQTAPFALLPLILQVNLVLENESIYHLLFLITTSSRQATSQVVIWGWKGKKWVGTSTATQSLHTPSPSAGHSPGAVGREGLMVPPWLQVP